MEFQREEEERENERSPSDAFLCAGLLRRGMVYHDCLPILELYIILAYLMLFAALSNAVCLYNASSFFY